MERKHIDRADWERAILPHKEELFGTAMRLTRSRSEAEDLLQDALARAWTFWHRFQRGTNARAWMHRILMNTFINGYRRKKREREILTEVQRTVLRKPQWAHQDSVARAAGLGDEVEAALSAIQPEFRTVVLLVDLQGLSYKEVARRMGCPIGTVMSRLHRGRRGLQRRLREYAEGEGYIPLAAQAA